MEPARSSRQAVPRDRLGPPDLLERGTAKLQSRVRTSQGRNAPPLRLFSSRRIHAVEATAVTVPLRSGLPRFDEQRLIRTVIEQLEVGALALVAIAQTNPGDCQPSCKYAHRPVVLTGLRSVRRHVVIDPCVELLQPILQRRGWFPSVDRAEESVIGVSPAYTLRRIEDVLPCERDP